MKSSFDHRLSEDGAPVRLEVDGSVATVTLSRPDRANALTTELRQLLLVALGHLEQDAAVRAVVLSGAGRAFCAGQDLQEHEETLQRRGPAAIFETLISEYNPIVLALTRLGKPVIAAVNGACAGAGLGIALACDLRIVAERAKFATAFLGIGLVPDSGVSITLAKAVGLSRASELLLLGRPIDSAEALSYGLASEVVADEELSQSSALLARRLADGPTLAFAATKRALWSAVAAELGAGLELEAEMQFRMLSSNDHREGLRAFLEKRSPKYEGR